MSRVLNIYSVKDVKTNQFMTLELYQNDLEAERALKSILKRSPDNLVSQYPEDFSLYRLGTFDTEKSIEEKYDEPQKVCDMSSIVQTETKINN